MLDLSPWPTLADLPCRPLTGGLINDTWQVGSPPAAVLQRVSTLFGPRVHDDIEAITAWVERQGLLTPRLIRTRAGELWHPDAEGRIWRALTWIPGVSHERLRDPRLAREAGLLVGRWHAATATLQHDFAFSRPGAHDTERHLRFLSDAVRECAGHRLIGAVAPLADELTERWASWDGRLDGPARIAHGDLKISNLRFDEAGVGLCLLDLDTMGRLPLDIELGDAWRSWCNRAGEDRADAQLDLELFAASADGYLAAHPLQPEEKEALVPGIERIALELAARFAADALREVYFGWNPAVAATRGEHNLLRAHGQASLARALRQARRPMERALGL